MSPRLLNALLFQLGWFACVAGGNRGALVAVLIALPLHARFVARDGREWLVAAGLGSIGLALDLAWQASGALRFSGNFAGVLPGWLAVLWLLFGLALLHSLAWLQGRPVLAALLGAVAGPLSYVAGLRLGAASTVLPEWEIALLMAPAWALLLPVLAELARVSGRQRLVGATP